MHISRVFFKISDVVNHPLRNYVRYGKTEVVKDLVYGEGKYGKMDFYFSRKYADGKMPVIFNVHGGGFVCGGKRYRSGIARRFASEGYFVVNINYTLAPEGRFPRGTRDCIAALNALESYRGEYPFMDTDRIILTGDSAGGYYAAHAAAVIFSDVLREKAGIEEKYTGTAPIGLLTFFAPFNPKKCLDNPVPLGVTEDIGVCLFGTAEREDFPFPDAVTDVTLNVNSDWCPVGIVAAENDMFCGGQERDMVNALEAAGVDCRLFTAAEKGDAHCTHLFPFMPGTPKIMAFADGFLSDVSGKGDSHE